MLCKRREANGGTRELGEVMPESKMREREREEREREHSGEGQTGIMLGVRMGRRREDDRGGRPIWTISEAWEMGE